MKKEARFAKCRACRLQLNVGDSVLKIEGCITIPYGKSEAVPETVYSCPNPTCIGRMPKWTNVRKVENIVFHDSILDSEKNEILNLFSL